MGDRFNVPGTFRGVPATFAVVVTSWGSPGHFDPEDGGSPPEGPEAECTSITDATTGAELLPATEVTADLPTPDLEDILQAIDVAIARGPHDREEG